MYWPRKVIIFDKSLIAKYFCWFQCGCATNPCEGLFLIKFRDVTTEASGTNAVAPKLSDTLTLFQPGGGVQILLTIAPWIHL